MKYIIITPVFNELAFVSNTLNSVINQTILPEKWIFIDDNSTDGVDVLIKQYCLKHSFIEYYLAPRIGNHKIYSNRVVKLFQFGLTKITEEFDLLVKLDADVKFQNDFFQLIIDEFVHYPELGIASGHLIQDGRIEKIRKNSHDTRGATKVYRKVCYDSIGGVIPYKSWDTVDNAIARTKGWKTGIIENAYFHHLKPEGIHLGNNYRNCYFTGYTNGVLPYYLPYFLLKIFKPQKPFLFCPFFQLVGYIVARWIDRKRPYPPEAGKIIRKEQKEYLKNIIK